ncbi:MAG TPA: FecR family protein [Candidatus Saccharimonadales bacterium]|nr:FecR family protein [Candidatus Saccharimonadales bacterium]
MKAPKALLFLLMAVLISGSVAGLALADESHARIVRLSLVQGDVRFTQEFHKDSLTQKSGWEVAPLNLPIRQGYAISTGSDGRAEIEFENGAMAFLSANTVIEFYDLSLYDGSVITRLVLRQGSGIFYVNPARGDYFSVTGGDFSVEADGRTRFRLDNFDDGSNVSVHMGHVNVLRKNETKSLAKDQSYFVNVNEGGNGVVGRAPDNDDFDKWVSGRIDSVATATAYANQYTSTDGYSSGFADLYTYGSWYNISGYGFGWQPYGVGMGWCPFASAYGNWMWDASIGWNFIGFAPWGWLPYHYGGWVFSPMYGWVWLPPTGFGYAGGYGYHPYRPVTGVWVHNNGITGLVPSHPLDGRGKTPINLGHGIYTVGGNRLASTMVPANGQKWSVEKNPGRNTLDAAKFAAIPPPTRVSRTILTSNAGSRPVTVSRDSSIVYDGTQHRFVNGNAAAKTKDGETMVNGNGAKGATANVPAARGATVGQPPARSSNIPAASRPNITPPRPSPGSVGTSNPGSSAGATWGGSRGSSGSSGSSSSHSSGSSAGSASGGSHGSSGGSVGGGGGGSSHH